LSSTIAQCWGSDWSKYNGGPYIQSSCRLKYRPWVIQGLFF
jgi:hypothetical protein